MQGRIQDFKLEGGAFKKWRRSEVGAKFFRVFRVKNHDFMPKNHIFSNFRGGRPPPWIRSCSAQAMLDEKLILICNTCGILINSLIVRCAICHQPNHEDCTIYDRQEHICPNCRIDTERPNEPTHVSIIEELENDDETLLKCTHSCPDKITNTPGYQV